MRDIIDRVALHTEAWIEITIAYAPLMAKRVAILTEGSEVISDIFVSLTIAFLLFCDNDF